MNIWEIVEDNHIDHWVIASASEEAIKAVKVAVACDDDAHFMRYKLPSDSELTIRMNDAGQTIITHTVYEWLLIHNYQAQYLACSEF